jgi:hypothetical protein
VSAPAGAATDVPHGEWAGLEERGSEREMIGVALVFSRRGARRSVVPGGRSGMVRSRLLRAMTREAEIARQGFGRACEAVEG